MWEVWFESQRKKNFKVPICSVMQRRVYLIGIILEVTKIYVYKSYMAEDILNGWWRFKDINDAEHTLDSRRLQSVTTRRGGLPFSKKLGRPTYRLRKSMCPPVVLARIIQQINLTIATSFLLRQRNGLFLRSLSDEKWITYISSEYGSEKIVEDTGLTEINDRSQMPKLFYTVATDTTKTTRKMFRSHSS